MLSTIGRSLAPTLSRPLFPFKSLNFTQSLPSFVTFERNSPATYRNNQGKLVQASHNEPRIDHTEDGKPLGFTHVAKVLVFVQHACLSAETP